MLILFILILIFIIIIGFYLRKSVAEETKKIKKKNAVITFLMLSDSYLPGIVTLAVSILTLFKNTKLNIKGEYITKDLPEKNFDLICMCDKNVSEDARKIILDFYDRIIDIEEFAISEELVKLNLTNNANRDNIKKTYASSLRKFQMLELTEYKKLLYTDADTVIFSIDFLDLFNLEAPAGITFAEFSTIEVRYKKESPYGSFSFKKDRDKNGDFVDATLLIIKPEKGGYQKLIDFAQENLKSCSVDAFCINAYWDKFYLIEKRYCSRYVEENMVMLDAHGSDYKPWFTEAKYYLSPWYVWAGIYNILYVIFMKKYNNKTLDTSYEKTSNIPRIEWPDTYKAVNEFFEIDRSYLWHEIMRNALPNRSMRSVNFYK